MTSLHNHTKKDINSQKTRAKANEHAFTVVDILVVVTIIAILSAIALPVFVNQQDLTKANAKDAWAKANANSCAQLQFTGQESKFSAQDGPDGTEAPKSCSENQEFVGGKTTYIAKKTGQVIQKPNTAQDE